MEFNGAGLKRLPLLVIAQLSSRQSVATNAAGIDNAGSKWSREAQTKFVPRGLRQDSIINGSLFHYNRKYFVKPHLFATEPNVGEGSARPTAEARDSSLHSDVLLRD